MSHKIGIQFNVDTAELKKLNELSKQIDEVKKKLKDLPNTGGGGGGGNSGPERLAKNLKQATDVAHEATIRFKNTSIEMSRGMGQMDHATRILTDSMGAYHGNMKTSISSTGKMTTTFKELDGTTKKVSAQFNEATGEFEDFKVQMSTLNGVAEKTQVVLRKVDPLSLGKKFDVYNESLIDNARIIGAVEKGGDKFTQTLVDTEGKLHKITAQIDNYTGEIRELSHETKAASKNQLDMAGFDLSAQNRIGTMAESMKGLNKQSLSVGESMRIAATRMLEWSASATLIYGTKRAFEAMLNVIVEVDTQMTELKKVMNEDTNFDKVLENGIDAANKFGQKLTDVNESLIEFGRQGLDESQIKLMTDATLAMANVGDVKAGDAASKLTGVLATFKVGYQDAMRVVDKFNEVQNNFPITVEDSASALEKAGATAQAFGVSLDETMGHVVAISQVTRESGSVVGNSLKTIYSRLTTMQPSIQALGDVGVQAFDDTTNAVRPVNDILGDLAGKWGGLTDEEKQNLAVTIAGRQQLSRFLALMDNYSVATEATTVSQQSYNSAMKENQTYMDSLQAKMNGLKTKLQELAIAMGDGGVKGAFGGFLEVSKHVLTGVTNMVEKFGAFGTILGGAGIGLVGKLTQQFLKLKDNSWAVEQGLAGANDIMQQFAGKSDTAREAIGRLYYVMGDLKTGLAKLAGTVLTNPFTWITVAITAISGLIGWLDNMKQKNKELAESAQTATEQQEEFIRTINSGSLDQTQFDMHIQKTEELKKGYADAMSEINSHMKGYDDTIRNTAKQTGDSMASIEQGIMASTKVSEVFNDEQREMYAQMGFTSVATGSLADFIQEYKDKLGVAKDTTKLAEDALKRQKDQAVHPLSEEYDTLALAVENADSALQTLMGTSDENVQGMWDTYNTVKVLQKVDNLTAEQKKELARCEEELANATGVSVEAVKKNVNAAKPYIESLEKEVEATGKARDGALNKADTDTVVASIEKKNEQQRREQIEKTKKATKKAEENRKKAYESKQKDLMSEMTQDGLAALNKQDSEKKKRDADNKTKDTSKKNTDAAKKNNKDVSKSNKDTSDKVKLAQGTIQEQLETSKAGFFLFGDSSKTAEKDSKSAGDNMKGKNGIKGAIDKVSGALEGVCGWWDDFKEKCKDPITGKITIKGILGGIFGDGGDPNAKIKEAAQSYMNNSSIAGKGFGGLRLSSPFGMRKHPITGKTKFHSGIDLAGPAGTPIRARHGGVVTYSGYNDGYGNMVQIRTNDGTVYRYAHNQSNKVKVGDIVGAGQTIGYIGSTGNSTGPHIHFEVRKNGVAINPTAYYHSGGVVDKQRKTNEVDARLQVGEMVLTHAQQANLFKMLSRKNHSTLKGHGIDEGGSRKQFFGQGGPTYSVRAGDTLSEIAVKYYGNAYNGGLTKLLKLNPKLKKNSVLHIGQKINVPSTKSSSSSSKKSSTKKTTTKKTTSSKSTKQSAAELKKQQQEKIDNTAQAVFDYMSKMQGLGAKGYEKDSYVVWKLLGNSSKFKKASNDVQKQYNEQMAEALSGYTDLNAAKKAFKKAKWYDLNSQQKNAVWKGIEASIKENIQEINDQKAQSVLDYISESQSLNAKGYDKGTYVAKKLIDNNAKFKKASDDVQASYNQEMVEALSQYTDLSAAKKMFKKAGWYDLNSYQKNAIWKTIEENVKANIQEINDKKAQSILDYISESQSLKAYGYDKPTYVVNKLLENNAKFKQASDDIQMSYNQQMVDALVQYTDLGDAKKAFQKAGWYDVNSYQKNAIWKTIEQSVKANIEQINTEKAQAVIDYMNKMEGLGAIQKNGYGYDDPTYDIWKLTRNRDYFAKASSDMKDTYNQMIVDALRQYTDKTKAYKAFKDAKLMGLNSDQLSKVWNGISKAIDENIMNQFTEKAQGILDYMSKMEGYGAKGYTSGKYDVKKLTENRNTFAKATDDMQNTYNQMIIDALKEYTNLADAKKAFNAAKLFDLNSSQLNAVWGGIADAINENILNMYNEKAQQVFDYMSMMEGYGAKGYELASYDVWKMIDNRATFAKAGIDMQQQYNQTVIDALREYENMATAKSKFNQAKLFGLNAEQLMKIWQGIEESINTNIFEKFSESTTTWLDKFNGGLKEAHQNVGLVLSAYEEARNRVWEEKKNDYVTNKSNSILASLGLDFDKLTEAEKAEQKLADLQQKIQARAEENALLEYRLKTNEDDKRLVELQNYMNTLNAQITATQNNMKKAGITDNSKIIEAQQPLKDKLAEIKKEYDELKNAINGSNNQIKTNEAEMKKLADEYKKLEKELDNIASKREFTDMWGNLVHTAEGATVEITQNGQLLFNTYANIKKELQAVKQLMNSGTGNSSVFTPILEKLSEAVNKYTPSINTVIDPADATIVNNSEQKTYQADTNGIRNVTYVVQTGVALASESELKEFAMILAGMIEEERARGNS